MKIPYRVRDSKRLGFCCFLHEGVQAGLLAGSSVLLDDLLLSGFVEGFDGLLECLLGFIDVAGSDSFTGLFDGALYNTVRDLVTNRVLGSDAHVLYGGFLDWHNATTNLKIEMRESETSLLYHESHFLARIGDKC